MKQTQSEISSHLVSAAIGYARAGLGLMFGSPELGKNGQASIGNLGIATELLLKAFIAQKGLTLLYTDLPLDLRCALAAPETMPTSFRSLPYEIDLKSSAYKSLTLDEAIATFCVFFPEFKTRLGSHLRFLSRHRNTCVHIIHPDCHEYEIERTAFLFLTLLKYIEAKNPDLVKHRTWGDAKRNAAFLAGFDEARLNRVHKQVAAAKDKAKSLSQKTSLDPAEWDWYPVKCPVCGSDGRASGDTAAEPTYSQEGLDGFSLTFTPETFECEQCGLQLGDYDEMKIAGVDVDNIDRSEESDIWEQDHDHDYDEY